MNWKATVLDDLRKLNMARDEAKILQWTGGRGKAVCFRHVDGLRSKVSKVIYTI